MHNFTALPRFTLLLAIWMSLAATPTLADSLGMTSKSEPWVTATHLGFSVNDQSSTGFKLTGGTMVMLDLSRPIGRRMDLGIRTIASGAKAKNQEFYRLGAGPMAAWRVHNNWSVHGAITNFNETGLRPGADLSYRSSGLQCLLGWERIWQLEKRVELVAGNFISYHTGTVSETASISALKSDRATFGPLPTKNFGIAHGAEIAIRLSM
ncbi:MAG: hypothetical protein FJ146_03930 [Deltaproteobacteria bacterium]|nr:hypothetical protein [Deltaproteobacteria bacterium]